MSNAAERYPSLDYEWIRAFPYALPMLIISAICGAATLAGYLYLEETLPLATIAGYATDSRGLPLKDPAALPVSGFDSASDSASAKLVDPGPAFSQVAAGDGQRGQLDQLAHRPAVVHRTGLAIFKDHKPFWSTVLYAIISFTSIVSCGDFGDAFPVC